MPTRKQKIVAAAGAAVAVGVTASAVFVSRSGPQAHSDNGPGAFVPAWNHDARPPPDRIRTTAVPGAGQVLIAAGPTAFTEWRPTDVSDLSRLRTHDANGTPCATRGPVWVEAFPRQPYNHLHTKGLCVVAPTAGIVRWWSP